MAAKTYAQLIDELNIWLQDTDDITFTSSEKEAFLDAAIRDPYVYDVARDSSLTTAANTYAYALPTGFSDQITMVGINNAINGIPTWLDREGWYTEGGYLYFELRNAGMPAGKSIILRGKKKLTSSDTFGDNLQNYILHLAMVEAFRLIQSQLTTRFYKNDITMGEVSSVIAQHGSDAARLRSTLENRLITEV